MHISSSRRSSVTGAGRLVVAAVAAVLPLAACAGGDIGLPEPQPTPTTEMPSPTRTAEDPVVPGPVGPDDPGNEEGAVLAWLPPGPASPNDPAPDSWYGALQERDCQGLANAIVDREVPLWTAAVLVCRALETGTPAAWDEAAAAAEGLTEPADVDCLDLAVYRTVLRALEFRTENPAVPDVSVEPSSGAACPVQLTGLSTGGLGVDEDPVASSCGGDEFRLMGRLTSVSTVTVGSTRVEAQRRGENEFWFVTPPGSPGVVSVTVQADDGAVPESASFTYLDASPCPTPTEGTDGDEGTEGDEGAEGSEGEEPEPSPTTTEDAPPPVE